MGWGRDTEGILEALVTIRVHDVMSIQLSSAAAFSRWSGLPLEKSLLRRYGHGLRDKDV